MRWRGLFAVATAVLLLAACGGTVELMAALPEAEANEVLAALADAGVQAEKVAGKEGMVSLRVEQDSVARAIDILRARGLPRERFARMGEVFKKEGLISSPLEERARYLWALSQELSGTIAEIDGVITARVHVVLPERSVESDSLTPSSAAVFIKHQESYSLEPVVPQIKRLVTNSIAGLGSDKVSVVLVPAQTPTALELPAAEELFGARIEAGSSGALRALLWGQTLVIVLLLAAMAAYGWYRHGRDWWRKRRGGG
ncbi:type III secretion system inner membrane ring lipoprotein SctJ [Chitinimonas lacunae]|uniref:Lipoprotein n=1 Tax=Chitinimonas lacunae TaxID=1963018 RepID=A0ABV8MRW0_9NEIS